MKLVQDGMWSNGLYKWMMAKCEMCTSEYQRRIDKTKQRFCSEKCYWEFRGNINRPQLLATDLPIIEGLLLSDGCITKVAKGKNYYFTVSSVQEEFIDFIRSTTSFMLKKRPRPSRAIKVKGRHQMYCGKPSWELRTPTSDVFTELRHKWYPHGGKIVPSDVCLTPMSVLFWYLGDGFLDNTQGCGLCTDSFDFRDIEWLRCKLFEVSGVKTIYSKKNRIIIPNSSVWEFFNFISHESPVSCYGYKWDTIVKSSYFNRTCLRCGKIFNTTVNHKRCCSDQCTKILWNIIRTKRRNSGVVALQDGGQ